MAEEPTSKVTYNVGDLLDRIGTRLDSGLSEIKTLMGTKADKEDLATINATLLQHDARLDKLEAKENRASALADQRRRFWFVANAVLMALLALGVVLGSVGVHI